MDHFRVISLLVRTACSHKYTVTQYLMYFFCLYFSLKVEQCTVL
jgi:hypothetical protein